MLSFSELLKDLILKKNCSQVQLADAIGIGKSTITRYLKDDTLPSSKTLEKIVTFFEKESSRENILDSFKKSKNKIILEKSTGKQQSVYNGANTNIPELYFTHILHKHIVEHKLSLNSKLLSLDCDSTVTKSLTMLSDELSTTIAKFKCPRINHPILLAYERICSQDFVPYTTSDVSSNFSNGIQVVSLEDNMKRYYHKVIISPPITREDTKEKQFEYIMNYKRNAMFYLYEELFDSSKLVYEELKGVSYHNSTSRKVYTLTELLEIKYTLPAKYIIDKSLVSFDIKFPDYNFSPSILKKELQRLKDERSLSFETTPVGETIVKLSISKPLLFATYTLRLNSPPLESLRASGFLTSDQVKEVKDFSNHDEFYTQYINKVMDVINNVVV